mgnify:CR=1 FL=1
MSERPRGILIVDLGAQYAQLIARRVREVGSWCEIHPPRTAMQAAADMDLAGIILSGGPKSVSEPGAPTIDTGVLELGVPTLGICYGMQLLTTTLGGRVGSASTLAEETGKCLFPA